MKIHSVGAKLFRTDGKTDMTKPIVAFRNFQKMPKRLAINNYALHNRQYRSHDSNYYFKQFPVWRII